MGLQADVPETLGNQLPTRAHTACLILLLDRTLATRCKTEKEIKGKTMEQTLQRACKPHLLHTSSKVKGEGEGEMQQSVTNLKPPHKLKTQLITLSQHNTCTFSSAEEIIL